MNTWIALSIAVVAYAGAAGLRHEILDPLAEQSHLTDRPPDRMHSPGPEVLGLATFNYAIGMSDLSWLECVQESGKGDETNWDRVEDLAEVTTDLDPRYLTAYDAAGTVLSVYGHRLDASDALLMKAIKVMPNEYRFPCLLGYTAYFERDDVEAAYHWFSECAAKPNAPMYAPGLAARLRFVAGDPDGAIQFLQELIPNLEGGARDAADDRLRTLYSERTFRVYDAACQAHLARTGERPTRGYELFQAGEVNIPAADDFGSMITFDENCTARTEKIPVRAGEVHKRRSRSAE